MTRLRPAVVVFDGTWPYNGIPRVRDAYPEARGVVATGMWRQGKNAEQLGRAAWFDEVLAPGELAEPYDRGATSDAGGVRVGPVTLLDTHELDDRETARRALGLPLDRPVALVTLGAGNINDTSHETGAVVAALRRLGVEICVTQTEIAESNRTRADVHVVREFPLSRSVPSVRSGDQCRWLQLVPRVAPIWRSNAVHSKPGHRIGRPARARTVRGRQGTGTHDRAGQRGHRDSAVV